MRPIDADKLKEDLFIKFGNQLPNGLMDEVDNATTIETDIEVIAKDAYDHGYTDGWKERFGEPDERPHGEWINDRGLYKCSECQTLHAEFWASAVPLERMYAFCPYCGADMRQEAARNEQID